MSEDPARPTFFASPAQFRRWLHENHSRSTHLWVGFHKVHTGKPSITWPQSVDQALSYGWIDGIRKRSSEDAYVIRFTPRRLGSIWSAVNTRRAAELKKLGLMAEAGLAALALRDPKRTAVYSFENRDTAFDAAASKAFHAKKTAAARLSAPLNPLGDARQARGDPRTKARGVDRILRTRRATAALHPMIRKLKSGEYRIYSLKVDPKTGRRRNLGTFPTLEAAKKHERDIQYFKRAKKP